ncbi:Pentatricopeptide repeat (PPR) superfamily protein [Euphorbia peplus]|nr:Pentatricopeptide repeat (PPR) superfamily protein [Euphorbia peplus]
MYNSINTLSFLLRNYYYVRQIAKQTHTQILVNNYLSIVTLQTDLILAYSKSGHLHDARKLFDRMSDKNMHSWNILIFSYVQNSLYPDAILAFYNFIKTGFRPDHYTLPPLFKASLGAKNVSLGHILHNWVIRLGFERYIVVGSSVLDFYLKCGELVHAHRVFSNMLWKDSGVWNLIISGFGRAGLCNEALTMCSEMVAEGVTVDVFTVPSILSACGGAGDLTKGSEIHALVIKNCVFDRDVAVANSLIGMYAKCGWLGRSEKVFKNTWNPNVVTWTTMISSYGVHGEGEKALDIFKKMRNRGCKPNPVTVTAILASCSHSGLIDQGREIFQSIRLDFGFEPSLEHYACMVDLLGRCGRLEEALRLVLNMKLPVTASVWGALLAGCVMHKNVEIGEIAAHNLFEMEPRNSSNYVALCYIYEYHSIWEGMINIRTKMREFGLVKCPGYSWITIEGTVHKFYQGQSHPLAQVMCKGLHNMSKLLTSPENFHEES